MFICTHKNSDDVLKWFIIIIINIIPNIIIYFIQSPWLRKFTLHAAYLPKNHYRDKFLVSFLSHRSQNIDAAGGGGVEASSGFLKY